MTHQINPIEINGAQFDAYVEPDGEFRASYKDNVYAASSRRELQSKLEEALKRDRLRISVPFVRLSKSGQVVQCEVTGKHAGNGNWLVNVGSKNGEQERWMDRQAIRPLSAAERAELRQLAEARNAAQAAVNEFVVARQFELREAVDEAWAEAGK